ncbi:hypothetical protein MYXE_30930 [Mycobacterium xenopi]|uniref:Amine oxidase domain-containing protein n=1 Tax=Mycobacterium xenopi TaxID=1789 RepID=A0AAD1M1P0_MYCXE|nr:hypothetical protein MYXE_30930 [Mycobacterium xenopi]
MTSRSYCIVGGGISGLTAAYRLRALVGDDVTITVFDPADRLGGVLRTERVGGQPVDVGAEAFVVRRPEVPALLAELGLSDRHLGTTGARPLIYSQGRLHPLPSGTIAGIPSSAAAMAGLVDEATVARIAAEPGRPLDWRAGDDPVTAALVADRFGPQVVARSVDPLLGGVYAGSAATIGVRSAAPGLAMALDGGAASLTDAVRAALPAVTDGPVFGAVDGGYAVLVDELIRRSGLSWERVGVERIEPAGPGWTLCDGAGGQWRADGVILAVPAPRLAASSPRLPRAARRPPGESPVHRRWWWRWRCRPVPGFPSSPACWWPAGKRCTPRRLRCRRASGAAAVASSWCGFRSGGSTTTWAAAPPTTNSWLGPWGIWRPCSG